MAAGGVSADASSTPPSPRLREAFASLSQAFDCGDAAASDAAVAAVCGLLDDAATVVGDGDDEAAKSDAARVSKPLLRELHAFLTCPSSNQAAIDALSLELPKAVAMSGALSESCRETAATIIEFFVSNCSPRDMLSILCEALDTPVVLLKGSAYFVLLLDGLARVLILIQRRHIEQVKVTLPVVLRAIHAVISDCDEELGRTTVDLFNAALRIGNAIQEISKAMADKKKEELCAILGLYALQNIALISRSKQQNILSACGSLVLQLSKFLTFCGFSYLDLLTGNDVTSATHKLSEEEGADFLGCFSLAMDGASLAVAWTCMYDDMSKYAGEELESALKEVQDKHIEKWQAINMFKYVLSSNDYPWIVKSHSIELLLTIVDGNHTKEINGHLDFSSYSPSVFATLRAIQRVMMAAPDSSLRKKAFAALKKVISMVPSSQRFDILQALIKNSISPSLTAILLDLVKDEVLRESCQADQSGIESNRPQDGGTLPRWISHSLELVELILRPPEGGPPCLPDHSEQVLSALNLLRFILIIDSKGSSEILPEKTMQKVYSDWLMPLRPIVAGVQSENEKDGGNDADHIMCLLNPVQLVLYRCIELVEEKMKSS